MTKLALWIMAALAAVAWLAPAGPAHAGDPTCNDLKDDCVIEIVQPSRPSKAQPADHAPTPKKKVVPNCADLGSGVVAPVGAGLADLGLADAAHAGWIRATCLERGERAWLWMDPGQNAESIARTLLARLQLEPPKIGWTPTTAGAMGYVGVPTWMWVASPGRLTWGPATIGMAGVTLTAKAESVTWSMGNGDEVRCANKGTEWRKGMGAGPSPTCGYLYQQQGTYQVRATAHWVARWSGYGRSGAIPLSLSQEQTLEVGEIQVIVNR